MVLSTTMGVEIAITGLEKSLCSSTSNKYSAPLPICDSVGVLGPFQAKFGCAPT